MPKSHALLDLCYEMSKIIYLPIFILVGAKKYTNQLIEAFLNMSIKKWPYVLGHPVSTTYRVGIHYRKTYNHAETIRSIVRSTTFSI